MGASYLNIHEIATPNKRFLGENGGRSVAMVARFKVFSCSVRSLLAKMPVRLLLMQKNSAKISKLFYCNAYYQDEKYYIRIQHFNESRRQKLTKYSGRWQWLSNWVLIGWYHQLFFESDLDCPDTETTNINLYHVTKNVSLTCLLLFITSTKKCIVSRQFHP